jgi:hypothetical protein
MNSLGPLNVTLEKSVLVKIVPEKLAPQENFAPVK